MSTSEEEKQLGNKAFSDKNYALAVEHFSKAIGMSPQNPVLYSNRSAAYAGLRQYEDALRDADTAIRLNPAWVRGHGRRATALHFLGRLREAKEEYERILAVEPMNVNASEGLREIDAELRRHPHTAENSSENGDGGDGGSSSDDDNSGDDDDDDDSLFPKAFLGDVFAKLASNPETAGYVSDKEFIENINRIRSHPDSFYQLCKDKKIITAAKVLAEEDTKARARSQQQQQQQQEEEGTGEESYSEGEEEVDEEEEEGNALAKAAAEQEKELGNRDYKAKRFETAIKHYQAAIELYPRDATYKSNMSAAYFEMNQLDKCIAMCHECLADARQLGQSNLVPKLLARIGTACYRKQDYDTAIDYYQKSLAELYTEDTYNKLMKAVEGKKTADSKKPPDTGAKAAPSGEAGGAPGSDNSGGSGGGDAQQALLSTGTLNSGIGSKPLGSKTQADLPILDAAKREEDRRCTLYRNGQYAAAVEAYTEAIAKDPKNASFYVSCASARIKLCDYAHALEDTETAISIDPKLSKKHTTAAHTHTHFFRSR